MKSPLFVCHEFSFYFRHWLIIFTNTPGQFHRARRFYHDQPQIIAAIDEDRYLTVVDCHI